MVFSLVFKKHILYRSVLLKGEFFMKMRAARLASSFHGGSKKKAGNGGRVAASRQLSF